MRFVLALILALWTSAPQTATAGAWLREQGTTFTSTSFSATYFRDIVSSTYMEHGLRDDLTIGLDVGYFTSRFGAKSGIATLFMRRSLGSGDGPNAWAYELGVGTGWIGEVVLPHIKTGLSWGRGMQFKDKNAWMSVDAAVFWDLTYGEQLAKVDATIGMKFTDVTMGIFQVYVTNLNGDTFGTVAPSVVFSPQKTKFKIQLGAETPLDNFDNTALKIGIWREF